MDRLWWVLFSVTVPESSKTESMKERQTEDMQKWQAAGTCVAVSCHCWFWSYIFLFLFVLWNEGVMLQWKHTCRVAKLHTHIYYACMHSDAWFARESWESRVLSLQQIAVMPHWVSCCWSRRWPFSPVKPQSIRMRLAQSWRSVSRDTLLKQDVMVHIAFLFCII